VPPPARPRVARGPTESPAASRVAARQAAPLMVRAPQVRGWRPGAASAPWAGKAVSVAIIAARHCSPPAPGRRFRVVDRDCVQSSRRRRRCSSQGPSGPVTLYRALQWRGGLAGGTGNDDRPLPSSEVLVAERQVGTVGERMQTGYHADFGPFDGKVWLNCAHQGPLPRVAADEARQAITWKVRPFELTAERFAEVPARLRHALGRLLGAPADEIILGNSASYGLHLLANSLPLGEGDEVLLVHGVFPSVLLPWLVLERRGVRVRYVHPARHLPLGMHNHCDVVGGFSACSNDRACFLICRSTFVAAARAWIAVIAGVGKLFLP